MKYSMCLTAAGISGVLKYDKEGYSKRIDQLEEYVLQRTQNDFKVFSDLNNVFIEFPDLIKGLDFYRNVLFDCLSSGIFISGSIENGSLDVELQNYSDVEDEGEKFKFAKIDYGNLSITLKRNLRIFKGLGLYCNSITNDKLLIDSYYFPIDGSFHFIKYKDYRISDIDLEKFELICNRYLDAGNSPQRSFSRYFVPLIINIIQNCTNDKLILYVKEEGDSLILDKSIFNYIKSFIIDGRLQKNPGCEHILLILIDRVIKAEWSILKDYEYKSDDKVMDPKQKLLIDEIKFIFNIKMIFKAIAPFLHDIRLISHDSLSFLIKAKLIREKI